MPRKRQPSLRGSVSQTSSTVRMRAKDETRLGMLVRLAIIGAVVLIVILTALWSWRSGFIHREMAGINDAMLQTTQDAHFAVADISVEGRDHTDKDALSIALGATQGSPIFAFDPKRAEEQIAKLPWVDSVVVERRLPDTIYVRLTEREPMARWQHDNHAVVIDRKGKILPDVSADQFAQLPLVVGNAAPENAKALLDALQSFPAVNEKVEAAVRVSERRWDLHLQPKVVAKLPETGVNEALKRLSILITEQKVLDRDILAIDLRMPDRLIIESATAPPLPHTPPADRRL